MVCLAIGAAVHPAQGQGFLRGLRDAVAGKVADAVLGPEEEQQQTAAGATAAFGSGMDQASVAAATQQAPERISPTALVKTRLQATASWDDVVTPSSASTLDALIRELPALPTVNDLVNPDAEKRAAYYRRIAAVNMRVEQLLVQRACSEAEQNAFVEKLYAEQAARYGISAADLRALDSGTLSAAEHEVIQQRIMTALGGGNMGGLMAMAAEVEAMAGPDGELTQEQAMALWAKHSGSLDLGGMMAAGQQYAAEAQRQTELYNRMAAIGERMAAGAVFEPGRYEAISRKYDTNLGRIYSELCATSDPAAVEAIYSRAGTLVRGYRSEAATAHLADLQKRMEALATAYPEMLALDDDMVAAGLMPPCSQRISSLNVVSRFANILDGAYRDFPQTEMLPVCREVILDLPENEILFVSESAMATTVEGFLDGSEILVSDTNSGVRYVYENGRKRPLGADEPANFANQRERPKPTYGHWTSTDGTRSIDYQQDGALMLHDGTIFYPLAFEADGNTFTWISQTDNNRLEKCIYKL
jgi:hypothetical protein